MKPSLFLEIPTGRLEARAQRARGLARQATEERERLERMLTDARVKETLACDAALKAEAAVLLPNVDTTVHKA